MCLVHGRRQWGQGGRGHPPDKVEGGLMVLFFGLVCSVGSLPPEKFSADALGLVSLFFIFCTVSKEKTVVYLKIYGSIRT